MNYNYNYMCYVLCIMYYMLCVMYYLDYLNYSNFFTYISYILDIGYWILYISIIYQDY